jgi:hypothetical protein
MVSEFDLPPEIIDRKVRKMKMISPTNREVDIGHTLKPDEYIGMTRREVSTGLEGRSSGIGWRRSPCQAKSTCRRHSLMMTPHKAWA